MMLMPFKLLGILAIVPTTMLLTVSFFVLFTNKKTDDKYLKTFGSFITVLLWFCAILVFSAGIFMIGKGYSMISPITHKMWMEHMKYQTMPSEQPPESTMHEEMEEKTIPPEKEKQ